MRLQDEPRSVRKVRTGMVGYGRTRALQILRSDAGVSLDADNYKRTWPLAFRIHFPPARDLDDEDLALSLAEGPWRAPLPADWPHGSLERSYERLRAEARITDAAAQTAGLFDDDEPEEEEIVDLADEMSVDLTDDHHVTLPTG